MEDTKRVAIILSFVFFLLVWVGLGLYGGVQAYHHSDREDMKQFRSERIRCLTQEVNELKQKIEILKSCVRWEIVLFDILSSQERAELDVIEEQVRQKIQKAFKDE